MTPTLLEVTINSNEVAIQGNEMAIYFNKNRYT